jgi:hypothetical protein
MPRLGDDPINLDAFYTEDGAGKSGLTVTFTLLDPDGNVEKSGSLSATSITGLYRYNAAADIDESGQWTFVAATTDTDVDQKQIGGQVYVEPAWATYVQAIWDALTSALTTAGSVGLLAVQKLGLIGTGSTSWSSPVTASGDLELYHGCDYSATDSLAPSWDVTGVPDFSAASIKCTFYSHGKVLLTVAATANDADTVSVPLTAAQTGGLPAGETCQFEIIAKMASGRFIPLVAGEAAIIKTMTPAW